MRCLVAVLSTALSLSAQNLVITEFMARNGTTSRDDLQGMSDWIEIHNPGAAAVSLSGWSLTDDPAVLNKFVLDNRMIPAGGYEVVRASGRNRRFANNTLHTNFELDGDRGEFLALVRPGGTVIASQFLFPPQRVDVSYGVGSGSTTPLFFDAPTPGAVNGGGYPGLAERVEASVARGFYDAPIAVALSVPTPGATIRYTLDGSPPGRTRGTVYQGPIGITTTTVLRAVAYSPSTARSRPATWSYLFLADVVRQPGNPPGFPSTWGTHNNGGSTYTAVADYAMDPAIVGSATYGPQMRDSLRALPTISITMDQDDLFGVQEGIYSNPMQDGSAWERPMSVEVLYPEMGRSYQANGGIRIMGRGSRRPWLTPKHSMRMVFRERLGTSALSVPLFGAGAATEFKTIALRSAFNDSFTSVVTQGATYLRDQLVRDLHQAAGNTDTHGTFAHVYLNGLYWGVFNPSERPDAGFQASYFGGDEADYDVLKHFNGTVVDGDRVAFDQAIAIANGGLSSASAYANLRQLIDVRSLADYMTVNIWAGTIDWPKNNWYMARRRNPAGAFKFFCWDAEASINDVNRDVTGVRDAQSPAFFYHQLRANAEFRVLFGDRADRMLRPGGVLTQGSAATHFARRVGEVRAAMVAETARWGDVRVQPSVTRDQEWQQAVDWIAQVFLPQRPQIAINQLQNAGLMPSLAGPVLSPAGGPVGTGVTLSMTAAQGQVWYTTNGADPRSAGGGTDPAALRYFTPITVIGTTTVRARVRDGSGNWSALVEAVFTRSDLRISEILARNDTGILDPAGEREDWIELTNTTARPVNATGLYLTDDLAEPTKWQIPAGTSVPPNGRLLIWADQDLAQGPLHAGFKLDRDGEAVWLFDIDGVTRLDGVAFGRQEADISLGRLEDTSGPWVTFPMPTPGQTNTARCRRVFSGRDQDLHPILLRSSADPRIGSLIDLQTANAPPNQPVLYIWSQRAAYLQLLQPANDIALLVGGPWGPPVVLTTNGLGATSLPIGLVPDPNLVGLRFYFQVFSVTTAGVRGSNALELTICR